MGKRPEYTRKYDRELNPYIEVPRNHIHDLGNGKRIKVCDGITSNCYLEYELVSNGFIDAFRAILEENLREKGYGVTVQATKNGRQIISLFKERERIMPSFEIINTAVQSMVADLLKENASAAAISDCEGKGRSR